MAVDKQQLAKLASYSGEPWGPGNKYFAHAEQYMDQMWEGLIWPMLHGAVDMRRTVDLAAGHGRNSAKLLEHCQELVITDIQPGNVEACRKRFSGRKNISYLVANGYDFQPIEDSSVTLIYCFDAMVHFDSDVVRSYLADARRILVPGGHGFFHHSNYTGGDDWRAGPHSRGFMSKELFWHYARKEGLEVVRQKVINWAGKENLDCVTLLRRPLGGEVAVTLGETDDAAQKDAAGADAK